MAMKAINGGGSEMAKIINGSKRGEMAYGIESGGAQYGIESESSVKMKSNVAAATSWLIENGESVKQ